MSDYNYIDMVRLCNKVSREIADRRGKKMRPIDGAWDMFELITSAYYGKQYYFLQDDGLVYSRASHKYMTEDAAITEFLDAISDSE